MGLYNNVNNYIILDSHGYFTSFSTSIPGTCATEEIEMVKRGIADLIQCLPMDEPINIEEYIDIDRNKEIISLLMKTFYSKRFSEALLGCDNMLAYIAQKNLNIDFSAINTLNNLRKKITQTSAELA
ncbi:2913_t:CDS:2 [Ambispora leptoticha]|uniref:2913_t:CDS:1 n=1 Tax=Ambispora leptoticha TaxID=144679 RepID=A0A9N9AZA7_9GLOM|nr:2913_t:CDS:2 [Ambispora leptoticha]